VGHDGSQSGGRSALLLEPAARRGVVVMSNSDWVDAMKLALDLLEAGRD